MNSILNEPNPETVSRHATGQRLFMITLTEADVKQIALDWLKTTGWSIVHGPDIAPDTPAAERASYDQVVLEQRLRDTIVLRQISDEVKMK